MAELHIVGSIDSGHGFAEAAGLSDLFLKWTLESGPNFRVVQGLSTGQTHCDHPDDAEAAVWSHPLDVHYTLKGIDGWPRSLEVWGVDRFRRNELAGYGVCMVPTTPGLHRLECATWRPSGTLREQLSSAPRELRSPPELRRFTANCARRRLELRTSPLTADPCAQPSSSAASPCSSTRSSSPRPSTASGCRPSPPASSRSTSASSSRTSRSMA